MSLYIENSFVASALNNSWQAAAALFERGGFVMWPLVLCSLVAAALAIERAIVFIRFKRRQQHGEEVVNAMLGDLQQGKPEAAIERGAAKGAGPVAFMLAQGLKTRDFGLLDGLRMAANRLLDQLRRGLSLLDTIITLGPLLGILGTVTGIIRSFHLLSEVGVQDPTAVTGGIAEALLTTAAGLTVAILALLPFNYFISRLKRQARYLEQVVHQCDVAYQQGKGS